MKKISQQSSWKKGYTLVETLVASAVIMVAVGAASSLSLAMVTQEEMSERTVRVANYLENAVVLYQLGIDPLEIEGILPKEPIIPAGGFTAAATTASVTGLTAPVPMIDFTVSYSPSASEDDFVAGSKGWTGGSKSVTRLHTVRVMRTTP